MQALLRFAKWTKDTPTVDQFFRPLDAIVDAVLIKSWGNVWEQDSGGEGNGGWVADRSGPPWRRTRRRKYPLPVAQGTKYPLK